MSATDRLWKLYQLPESASAFQDALDDHAHELAEKIRGLVRHPAEHSCDACHIYRYAADVIDPEVGE